MRTQKIIIALMLTAVFAHAQTKAPVKLYNDKLASTISYAMHHPMHSWVGVSKEVSSVILIDENKAINKVAVSIKISSFDSDNANRDSHVMETTEAIKYPSITFSSDSIVQSSEKLMVTGTLTFHGVSQVISFNADRKNSKDKIEVSGSFVVKMTQFKIEPPSLMGMATDDDFKIEFSMNY